MRALWNRIRVRWIMRGRFCEVCNAPAIGRTGACSPEHSAQLRDDYAF